MKSANSLVPSIVRHSDQSITMYKGISTHSLIWLHGLGGEAENFVSFFNHSDSPLHYGFRIRLLQAPCRKFTLTNSYSPSWYDIFSKDRFTAPEQSVFNFEQLKESKDQLQRSFFEEMEHWKKNQKDNTGLHQRNIFVGGMSQGGVTALHFGLETASVGGVVCFSGYLLKATELKHVQSLPTLLVHGNKDEVIRQVEARQSYERLMKKNRMVDYRTIRGLHHTVCLEEIGILRTWLNSCKAQHGSARK